MKLLSAWLSPMVLLLIIAIVIVLIIVLMLWVLWRIQKKQEAAEQQPQEETALAQAPAEKKDEEKAPALRREVSTSPSFSSALHFLRENSAGGGGRYRTPWFLVLGAADSGKSTLLEHSGISLSLREGATDFGISRGIQWRFFDAGVILDIPGEFFMQAEHTSSDERSFRALLRNLVKHRPQRPIDGVVLTIPCTELFGAGAISPVLIKQRAAKIFDNLWTVEKYVGLSFPVYVIVTKCDAVPGFSSLASQLPSRYRREMFGWSSPHNLEAAFEPEWIDQGFEDLARELNRLQSEVFVEQHDIAAVDDIFLLSGRLQELRTPLRAYLGHIFKESAYRESLKFRGFYFTGDAPTEVIEIIEPQRALAAAASSASEATTDYLSIPGDVLGLTPSPAQPQAAPIFVSDLFENKIFPERGLARPVSRVHLSKNRWLVTAQAACLIAVVVLTAGVWIRYGRLAEARNEFVPMLDKVYEELTSVKGSPGQLSLEQQDSANYLVRTVQSTSTSFRTIFYPSSLLSPIETKMEQAMVPVFQELVYKSFRQQLLKKGAILASPGSGYCAQTSPAILAHLNSYQQLCAYTTKLLLLESNIDTYNTVSSKDRGDIHELAQLEAYLSGSELDVNLKEHTHIFDLALKQAVGEPIGRNDVNQNSGASVMRSRTQKLFEDWFPGSPLLQELDIVREKIDQLDGTQTSADLIALQDALTKVKADVANPQLAWVGKNSFELTPDLAAVTIDVINKSRYVLFDQSESLRMFVNDSGRSSFEEFRAKRDNERTQLTGSLLDSNNDSVHLADNADRLRAYLDDLLKQPFAQRDQTDDLRSRGPAQQLIWNKDLLQEASNFEGQYQSFIKPELASAPPVLHDTFDTVALGRLEDSILELVAQAEKLEPLPASDDPELSIVPELLSFQDAAPLLDSLLSNLQEIDSSAYDDVLKVSVRQATSLLARIDTSYEAQAPYASNGLAFNHWNGDHPPAWASFDVHNSDEVSQYVLFQRQQVQQYAAKAAPLVNFLEPRMIAATKDANRTLAKWRGIVDDVQKFNTKVPGTALANLENFLTLQIDKVTPDNCQADFLTTALSSSNYFAQRQDALRRSLYTRCVFLSEQNAVREYAAISKLFNSQLAGKFPFAAAPREQMPNEADPQDIVKLYGMLDQYGSAIRSGLQKGDFGSSYASVLNFLNQMDGLRPFFGSLLSSQAEAVPAFDFIPAFRVNQDREINGNEIIDWTLQVGTQSFHYRDPERTGRWNFGDPVKLALRWAKDSPQRPATASASDDSMLKSRTLSFEYRDSWSLLRMILLHRPAPSDFDRMVDPDPQTLVFTVADTTSANPPNATGDATPPETKVFVRIRLRSPGKPDNLRLHGFPTEAPDLSQTQARSSSAGGNP